MLVILLSLLDNAEDKDLLLQIYNEYNQTLFKLARKYLFDSSNTEDCVQETFVELIKSFDKYKAVPEEKQKAYIARICRCVIYKINNSHIKETESTEIEEVADCEENDFSLFDKMVVAQALNLLDDKYRIPIILKYMDDLSTAEIAEKTGLSQNLVLQRLHRGKKLLYKLLTEDLDYDRE